MASLRARYDHRSRSFWAACVALVIVTLTGCQRSGEWNGTFHRSEGWWYSDGGGSAELPNGKTVWLFGDTWLRHNRHVLPNSMAVQDTEPGQAPRRDQIRFFARGERGQLLDVTADGRQAKRSWAEPVERPGTPKETWLWPTSALVSDGKLVAMYVEVTCEKGRFPECRGFLGNMGFAGHSVIEVENPAAAPEEWQTRTTPLTDRRGQAPPSRRLHWGSALLEEGGWLYVFGVGLGRKWAPEDVKLARVLPRDVRRYDLWQFLTPDGWRMLPTGPAPSDLQTLAHGGATELSVHRIVRGDRQELFLVQVDPLAQEVVVRTAPASEVEAVRWTGPEEGERVRRFPIAAFDPETAGGMNWAGRAHPHHSQDERGLLISYFSERLHSLRFFRLPTSEMPE